MSPQAEPLRLTTREYCARFWQWVELAEQHIGGFKEALPPIRLAVIKSCLLDRMLYAGEQPSQTPCPVHEGRWTGCHGPWPGWVTTSAEGTKDTPPEQWGAMLMEWYDRGCRCAYHRGCSCTTGWQPDEACGCAAHLAEQEQRVNKLRGGHVDEH